MNSVIWEALCTSCMKTRRLGFVATTFLIPPASCSAVRSKYIKLTCSFVKSKLENGAQDNQSNTSISLHKFMWHPKMQADRPTLYNLILFLSDKPSESLPGIKAWRTCKT